MQNEFNSSMENETDSSGAFETIMINALQVPGVKVNFFMMCYLNLNETLKKYLML